MFVNPAGSGKGYQIAHAVRLRSAASAYFSRTFGTPTSQNTWTLSFLVKRGSLGSLQQLFQANAAGGASDTTRTDMYFYTDDTFVIAGGTTAFRTTSAKFRDPTAWLHFVISVSLPTATIYVNGVAQSATSNTWNTSGWNSAVLCNIGRNGSGSQYFDGLLSDVYFIDGQALTPSSFGETNSDGVWVPKAYTGTYGNNGFYLKFNDGTSATTLGYDRSGNGNNWTASGISTTAGVTYDWLTDTPTNNYATLNALNKASNTYSDGNLKVVYPASGYAAALSTIAMTSGQYWAEMTVTAAPGEMVGIIPVTFNNASGTTSLFGANGGYGYRHTGNKYVNGVSSAYGATFTTNDVIGIHLNLNVPEVTFYKQTGGSGSFVSQGAISITSGLSWLFAGADGTSSGSVTQTYNFGQRPFNNSSLPSGAVALCTANLPAVTIPNLTQAVAHRYEAGGGIAANIASDRGSWASWIEIFKRGDTSESWKVRFSTDTSNMWAFDSNAAKAAWSAPSAGTYLGIALRVGSTYGIDTGTYSGNGSASQDVSHSLGVAPTAAIIKDESTGSVYFWHSKMTGATYFTIFNSATPPAQSNTNTPFGGSGWLSSTFGVTNNATNNLNASSHTYRYILFSDVSGLLRMLGFTGNGSTDGAFEYAGQRPQIQIEKDLAATTGIYLFSDMIDTYNVTASYLLMNSSAAVAAATGVDIVANGIKHRSATVVNAANSHAAISLSRQSFGGSNVSPACAR